MTATLHPRRLTAPPAQRLAAAAIDLAIIALPTLAIALVTAERFLLLDPATAPTRFAPLDERRIDAIGESINRAVEWNGTLHVLDGRSLLVTGSVLVGAALIVNVLFPALGGGRSPGKTVAGLRVIADDGSSASVEQHLVRTIAGPIDLLGLILPGLLGTILAWSDSDRRRLGDRLAGTRVAVVPSEWVIGAAADTTTARPDTLIEPSESVGPDDTVEPDDTAEPMIDAEPIAILLLDSVPPTARTQTGEARVPPAPPRFPVRRQDGSATRSPQSRRGATRADTSVATRTAKPGLTWLGAPGDGGWDVDRSAELNASRSAAKNPGQPFHALLLPESSLAESSLVTTRQSASTVDTIGASDGAKLDQLD